MCTSYHRHQQYTFNSEANSTHHQGQHDTTLRGTNTKLLDNIVHLETKSACQYKHEHSFLRRQPWRRSIALPKSPSAQLPLDQPTKSAKAKGKEPERIGITSSNAEQSGPNSSAPSATNDDDTPVAPKLRQMTATEAFFGPRALEPCDDLFF
ncbi:hypothetical protein TruAng_006915 [Truncatella angustata]|nr:hypothetical protein TruAng_006915 [Truncatella angustata]